MNEKPTCFFLDTTNFLPRKRFLKPQWHPGSSFRTDLGSFVKFAVMRLSLKIASAIQPKTGSANTHRMNTTRR